MSGTTANPGVQPRAAPSTVLARVLTLPLAILMSGGLYYLLRQAM